MDIKNKSGPSADSCGTPDIIFLHSGVRPFKITLFSWLSTYVLGYKSISPSRPYAFKSNMIPPCQTLSKVFDVFSKTPPTSTVGFSSKAVSISWIIDNNWAIHRYPGRKPDWKGVKSLLFWK